LDTWELEKKIAELRYKVIALEDKGLTYDHPKVKVLRDRIRKLEDKTYEGCRG